MCCVCTQDFKLWHHTYFNDIFVRCMTSLRIAKGKMSLIWQEEALLEFSHYFPNQRDSNGFFLLLFALKLTLFWFFSPPPGCEAFSRSGAIHPTKERSRRSSGQHESFWRARWWRRRRRGSRGSQWRGGNHSHTQLPHHLLPFRPGKPTQQVLPPCHSEGGGQERAKPEQFSAKVHWNSGMTCGFLPTWNVASSDGIKKKSCPCPRDLSCFQNNRPAVDPWIGKTTTSRPKDFTKEIVGVL